MDSKQHQNLFWNWVDQHVQRLVVGWIEMILRSLLHEHLQAAWNQRTPQPRVADVERILRHAYLLGVSTCATAQRAERLFGGMLSHQTISTLSIRWPWGTFRRTSVTARTSAIYP
jgi:hypothetical protein